MGWWAIPLHGVLPEAWEQLWLFCAFAASLADLLVKRMVQAQVEGSKMPCICSLASLHFVQQCMYSFTWLACQRAYHAVHVLLLVVLADSL